MKTIIAISAIAFCLAASGVVGGPNDAAYFNQRSQVESQRILDQLALQRELEEAIVNNNRRLGDTVTRYDGPARRTRPEYQADRKRIRANLLESELLEAPK